MDLSIETMPHESIPEREINSGARPTGAIGGADAAQNIQQMFDSIAPRYDLLNHVLSAGVDRLWWSRTARALRTILARPEATVVDLCCGTGDMTLALDRFRPQPGANSKQPAPIGSSPILAIDFSHAMLSRGAKKFAGRNILPIEADALHLPLASNSVDLVTSAFGFRNLASYPDGLAELHRVLRPGGEIAILDFNQPTGLLGLAYNFYFRGILPRLGRLLSSDPAAYTYLPESVARFPRPARMIELITTAGFVSASWTSYTFGVAGVFRAIKPYDSGA
jgi:demethylmenaquinone methyltransferase/2-methoxy-6-polyprenyl-1,4-benzoquinol methylase